MSNVGNYDKKSQIIRMHHMFQKRNQSTNSDFDLDSLPQHQQNLSRIVKRYQTRQDNDLEIKTNSLVSNVKSLIETHNIDLTKPLYDYLESIKVEIFKAKEEFVEPQEIEENEINEIEIEEEEIIKEEEVENKIDIESLLQTTEKEISNTRDQKTLLRNLIDDVKLNSNKQTRYDESRFERNMTDIINETKEEQDEEEVKEEKKKKSKLSSLVILLLILLILGGVAYFYKDIIIEYYKQFLVQQTMHFEEVAWSILV